MSANQAAVVVLNGGGTSLVIELSQPVPRVLHWGAQLPELGNEDLQMLAAATESSILNNAPDTPRIFSLWPTERDAWQGTPAQEGNIEGTATTPRPQLTSVKARLGDDHANDYVVLEMTDSISGLVSKSELTMDRFGVLSVKMSVTRREEEPDAAPYILDHLTAMMPLPERATAFMDFTGRWCRERAPQRGPLSFGTHLRVTRRGKPGHDSPLLLIAGTDGFGSRTGELWATHVAWSGDQRYLIERLPEGAGSFTSTIGGGELLRSGEIRLMPGEEYQAPCVYFIWSDRGTDGIADRLHQKWRAKSRHPSTPRPLVLNTWEAVYFDHDLARLEGLIEAAARVGVERVVLDDGWFLGRHNPHTGLGDWFVDPATWPNGLDPLVQLIRERGMDFGLWFEPEMINLDSELARQHPDWILAPSSGIGPSARDQYVLNIANPNAYAYLLKRMDALVSQYQIDYIKWDHNRDLLEAVTRGNDGDRPSVHEQTIALYQLLDELQERHPGLEIETCSGGGGRIDLGILERTSRVWPSDCNDPVERSRIERWTALIVPPEMIGSHLGTRVSHTTGRATDIQMRLATSLFGHAGIEMDLTTCDTAELALITRWAAMYKELRPLLHSGTVVNADLADTATGLHGVVSTDLSHAVFAWTRWETSPNQLSARVRFPGLDTKRRYHVQLREDFGPVQRHQVSEPQWLADPSKETVIAGSILSEVGVVLPALGPQQTLLFELTAV